MARLERWKLRIKEYTPLAEAALVLFDALEGEAGQPVEDMEVDEY